jgi:hypothetical protein
LLQAAVLFATYRFDEFGWYADAPAAEAIANATPIPMAAAVATALRTKDCAIAVPLIVMVSGHQAGMGTVLGRNAAMSPERFRNRFASRP